MCVQYQRVSEAAPQTAAFLRCGYRSGCKMLRVHCCTAATNAAVQRAPPHAGAAHRQCAAPRILRFLVATLLDLFVVHVVDDLALHLGAD
jgi:hypothetical protein